MKQPRICFNTQKNKILKKYNHYNDLQTSPTQ